MERGRIIEERFGFCTALLDSVLVSVQCMEPKAAGEGTDLPGGKSSLSGHRAGSPMEQPQESENCQCYKTGVSFPKQCPRLSSLGNSHPWNTVDQKGQRICFFILGQMEHKEKFYFYQ